MMRFLRPTINGWAEYFREHVATRVPEPDSNHWRPSLCTLAPYSPCSPRVARSGPWEEEFTRVSWVFTTVVRATGTPPRTLNVRRKGTVGEHRCIIFWMASSSGSSQDTSPHCPQPQTGTGSNLRWSPSRSPWKGAVSRFSQTQDRRVRSNFFYIFDR
jgi:hypothetical protein